MSKLIAKKEHAPDLNLKAGCVARHRSTRNKGKSRAILAARFVCAQSPPRQADLDHHPGQGVNLWPGFLRQTKNTVQNSTILYYHGLFLFFLLFAESDAADRVDVEEPKEIKIVEKLTKFSTKAILQN